MNTDLLRSLLQKIASGKLSIEQALEKLQHYPLENLEFARVDHHRALRQGTPEVIFAPGKTDRQILTIAKKIRRSGCDVLITRLEKSRFTPIKKSLKGIEYFPDARLALAYGSRRHQPLSRTKAVVLVCCAGTSDIPVAEEAALTAWLMGCPVERLYDVGVAGIHRLFDGQSLLNRASVIVVAAGMDGALPSVIGGLVKQPIIAIPTSIGYGASFGGISALLAMLNSCASGVVVVNIDNGFGAGCAASLINQL